MRHRLTGAFRIKRHLANSERATNLHELANSHDAPARGRLPQEIDGKTRCNGKGNYADFPKDGDVKRDISDTHEHGTRDRSTRPQFIWANRVRDCSATVANLLDDALRLWKLGGDERCDFFFGGHDRS
jgi:hypothetical protein